MTEYVFRFVFILMTAVTFGLTALGLLIVNSFTAACGLICLGCLVWMLAGLGLGELDKFLERRAKREEEHK